MMRLLEELKLEEEINNLYQYYHANSLNFGKLEEIKRNAEMLIEKVVNFPLPRRDKEHYINKLDRIARDVREKIKLRNSASFSFLKGFGVGFATGSLIGAWGTKSLLDYDLKKFTEYLQTINKSEEYGNFEDP